jgi:hypothetical protein
MESRRRARVREWFVTHHWPASRRRRAATVVALVAIVVATAIASSRLLRLVFPDLDLVAYAGLFVASWVGAGGALVPIPGVRGVSWFMVVHQGAALDPVTVSLTAATAMVLGQSSYFLAARTATRAIVPDAGPVPGGDTPAADPDEPAPVAPVPPPPVEARSRRARAVHGARLRIERQVRVHPMLTAFAVTALPSPLTTLATVASASLGTRYPRWAAAAFAGYLLFCSILALVGQGIVAAVRSIWP